MTPDAFNKNIVDMTVFSGISLRFFSQPDVLAMIDEMARKVGVSLNRNNIKKLLLDEYESQKKQMKSKSSNKFVNLKMDACTREHHHVSYFAINVRYADEGKNCTKIVARRDTQAQHSRTVLTQLGKYVLQDYGLQKDQVLCIVTDNASSMVSMVKQLNKRSREESSTTEESGAEIQEQSGDSNSNQLVKCDDLTITRATIPSLFL